MTCVKKKTTSIKLEAVHLLWGIEQCRSIKVLDAANVGGKYFELNLIKEDYTELKGYVYLDDGDDLDPAPAGLALITEVDFLVADTEAELAAKIKIALEASAFADIMQISVNEDDADTLDIANVIFGVISDESGLGDSGFTYTDNISGLGGDLGKTAQGGVTLNLETQTFELKSDQTAELLLGEINQGNLTTIEASLIELTEERFKTLIGSVVGENIDLGGDENYVGLGTSRLYQELSSLGGRMVLHPVRITDLTDRSNDWSFHITAPLPASINFSGTDQQAMEMSFKPYVDETKDARAAVGGFGDWLAFLNL